MIAIKRVVPKKSEFNFQEEKKVVADFVSFSLSELLIEEKTRNVQI